jgi:hypothetical protein
MSAITIEQQEIAVKAIKRATEITGFDLGFQVTNEAFKLIPDTIKREERDNIEYCIEFHTDPKKYDKRCNRKRNYRIGDFFGLAYLDKSSQNKILQGHTI